MKLHEMDNSRLQLFLTSFGVEPTRTNLTQLRELLHVMDIFVERNAVREDLWKEGGAEDSAHHAKSKAKRLVRYIEQIQDLTPNELVSNSTMFAGALDDAYDLANYALFFARNVQDGRISEG